MSLTVTSKGQTHVIRVDNIPPRRYLEGDLVEIWVKREYGQSWAVFVRDLSFPDYDLLQRTIRLRDTFLQRE